MGNRKRKKRGSNSSVHSEADMTNEDEVKHSIDALTKAMEAGFASLHVELDKLRLEFKHEIDEMKDELKSLKESISFTQDEVDTLKEKSEKNLKEMKGGLEELNMTIAALGIDTANIKFHAVHRVGKKMENRCRPIIARCSQPPHGDPFGLSFRMIL